jgi:hypothetical protein
MTAHHGVVAGEIRCRDRDVAGLETAFGAALLSQRPGMDGVEHHVSGHEGPPVRCDELAFEMDDDLGERAPDLDPSPRQSRRHRVVDVTDAYEPVFHHPRLGVRVDVRQRVWQGMQEAPLDPPRVSDLRAHAPVVTLERNRPRPVVVLGLQVLDRVELAQRQKRGLEITNGAFVLAFALREPGTKDHRTQEEMAEQCRDLVDELRTPTTSRFDDAALVVGHRFLRHTTQTRETPERRGHEVRRRPREREACRVRSRVRQRRHQPERFPVSVLADRNRAAGVPPVQLGELARQITRALIALRRDHHRAQPREALLQHGDPTRVTQRTQSLQDHRRRRLRVLDKHRHDVVIETIERRSTTRPLVTRRFIEPEQPIHGVAAHLELLGDRRLRPTLPMEQAMDLSPVLHVTHPSSPSRRHSRINRLPRQQVDRAVFDRRQVLSIGPSSTSRGPWCGIGAILGVMPGIG